jgi:hypothetical protein
MNYLLAETPQPEKKRVHPPEAAYLHRTLLTSAIRPAETP